MMMATPFCWMIIPGLYTLDSNCRKSNILQKIAFHQRKPLPQHWGGGGVGGR